MATARHPHLVVHRHHWTWNGQAVLDWIEMSCGCVYYDVPKPTGTVFAFEACSSSCPYYQETVAMARQAGTPTRIDPALEEE